MARQIPIDPAARAPEILVGGVHELGLRLAYQRLAIVNVVYHGVRGAGVGRWVLIDAGVPGAAAVILNAAARLFGSGARPAAIVMTHGHFDHVGALEELAARWDVPAYAHELELPYLAGEASYPPPDPAVGGGLVSTLSRFYPRGPVDVSRWLQALPPDGTVPEMPGWHWIHTPGHTPGHVSLWNEAERSLIAGDAFVTTAQESAFAVLTQRAEVHGPPQYFTQDWEQARASVERLAALEPELAITGHGRALAGDGLRRALHALARDFDRVAVPGRGRYVRRPVRADDGTAYPPPAAAA